MADQSLTVATPGKISPPDDKVVREIGVWTPGQEVLTAVDLATSSPEEGVYVTTALVWPARKITLYTRIHFTHILHLNHFYINRDSMHLNRCKTIFDILIGHGLINIFTSIQRAFIFTLRNM